MDVAREFRRIREQIDQIAESCGRQGRDIRLVAVSKTFPFEHCLPAYEAGCRDFGENRVQEALEKIPEAPEDIRWHFIGSLQSKKVPKVVGNFALIHAVDSLHLAERISAVSKERGITTSVLLQVNTSGEASKHGWGVDAFREDFEALDALPGLDIQGLMTMAPFTEDEGLIRQCFASLRQLKEEFSLRELSMGMTNDFPIAIEEGATILRIGSAIFGQRAPRP